MTVDTIVVGILAILFLGLAIYLWIDRKKWFKKSLQRMTQIYALQEDLKETVSLFAALDDENAQLTVKCNQYEALIGERLDEIFEVNCCEVDCEKCLVRNCKLRDKKDECNQKRCDSGECCKTCSVEGCPDKEKSDISFKKPCCSCDNGVYNTAECVGCGPENSYENYTPIKY